MLAAVRMQRVGQYAAIGRGALALLTLEHDRARAIAEQHAGPAVVPVQDAREGLRADHQRGAGQAVLDQAVGHGHTVDKARAHGLQIESGALVHSERLLHRRRRRRESLVRRGRRQHDQVEIGACEARVCQRPLCGLDREVRRELTLGRDMALLDSGALLDPLVGGIHLLGQFVVGDDSFRQIGAAPLNH